VGVGSLATMALDVSRRLAAQGIPATVVDPRWVLPVDPALLDLVRAHRLVVTLEDGVRVGGVGARLAQEMRDGGIEVPLHDVGIPCAFHDHGSRREVMEEIGLTAQAVARDVAARVARLDDSSGRVLT
jgi:1-deoxy-D-xylulose-5-phosphate synthase